MAEIITSAENALLTNSIANLKSFDTHAGRPPKYEDSEPGLERFKNDTVSYFENVKRVNSGLNEGDKPLIITVEGWLVSLGLTRQSLSRYRARGQAWQDFIDYTREIILSNKLQRYMTGQTAPVQAIFDLCNNHNYRNTADIKTGAQEITITSSQVEYPQLSDISK